MAVQKLGMFRCLVHIPFILFVCFFIRSFGSLGGCPWSCDKGKQIYVGLYIANGRDKKAEDMEKDIMN